MDIRDAPCQRLVDLLVAVPLGLVAMPLCLLLLALIRLDSPGAPLFIQTRVGRGQRPFRMLKLRTMRADTVQAASHEVGRSSITRMGAFLRRTKLDELPQLWNVIAGDMALVGPRPCLPVQEELVTERAARNLFAIRPGVTGPAQLAGIDMSEPLRLAEVEAAYFGNPRPFADLPLLLRTVLGGGSGDAALAETRKPQP